ncbi:MAG: hypothetical protein RL577_679 [Bacteroidota bacterium]
MSQNPDAYPNRLLQEASPYLQQHAYNPVDWHPWGNEAWEIAAKENKLVWVSIGYSACHWCHVMEHESFEDQETAEIMNHHFVNIKVDREERPDVDSVYMDACQLMTGRGGWPLNVCCTPDRRPLYAGTYFPNAQWKQVLLQLAEGWRTQPDTFRDYTHQLMEQLREMHQTPSSTSTSTLNRQTWSEAYDRFSQEIDWEYGGLKRSPKFMLPNQHEYNLDVLLSSESETAREYLHLSLIKMSQSGIYDTLRGGFYRYSTDRFWFAPHFEKMLYDNAQLVSLYARAYAYSGADLYKELVHATLAFCRSELYQDGAYGCALDADSEGKEGHFYTFSHSELKECLDSETFELAQALFEPKTEGNWEEGRNILHSVQAPLQVMQSLELNGAQFQAQLSRMKAQLVNFQNQRTRPGYDHKRLCSWNGLMLKALADAAFYANEPEYKAQALELSEWMWTHFRSEQGLLHAYAQDQAYIEGQLEDYAHFAQGLLAIYQAEPLVEILEKAQQLMEEALTLFYHSDTRQLMLLRLDQNELPINKVDNTDDVISSPNSSMALCLWELGLHLGESRYTRISEELWSQVSEQALQQPQWYSQWMRLAHALMHGGMEITLCGKFRQPETRLDLAKKLPSWVKIAFAGSPSVWSQQEPADQDLIFVCSQGQCFAPVQNLEQAWELIDEALGLE